MKTVKLAMLALSLLGLMACSSTAPIQTDHLKTSEAIQLRGEIVAIEEVKISAEFAKRFNGAVAGQIIGAGLGRNSKHQSTLKFLGTMGGVRLANKYYGRTLTRITVVSVDMQRFKALVPSNFVSLDETVRFTVKDDEITSMVKEEVIAVSAQTAIEST